jgi:hypothetical protein
MPTEWTGTDPGRYGRTPSDEELAARSVRSVADMVQEDFADPATPSRLSADGTPAPGSFDVDLE